MANTRLEVYKYVGTLPIMITNGCSHFGYSKKPEMGNMNQYPEALRLISKNGRKPSTNYTLNPEP